MDKEYKIEGRILRTDKKPYEGLKVKVYDENGVFLASALTDKNGKVDIGCGIQPKYFKVVHNGMVLYEADFGVAGNVIDVGDMIPPLYLTPPGDWHIKGIVKDRMSGDPLQGLTVEAWDLDKGTTATYNDPLGEDITDAAGEFNIWFDSTVFERDALGNFGEKKPDVYFIVKNAQGVEFLKTKVDENVTGVPHDCSPYWTHKGKEYLLEVDYVTAVINKIGPVQTADIDTKGLASFGKIDERPFGGGVTISGRVWGGKVDSWKLYYVPGSVDSTDTRIAGLGPTDANPPEFKKIADGTNSVWDGPIDKWETADLEGLHTIILVVWDDKGNEFHDTQIVYLHNAAINPPAHISFPAPGSTANRATDGQSIEIQGTANDDHFYSYALNWAGCDHTGLNSDWIIYPPSGNKTPVVNGHLGTWDISQLKDGPYFLRLSVHDKTIVDDGARQTDGYTWNTLNIVSQE